VQTADGRVVGAAQFVPAAGAWTGSLVPDLRLRLQVERESVCWFTPTVDPAQIGADRMPMWVVASEGNTYYGFRHDPEVGLKVSIHRWGVYVDPDRVDRIVSASDVERVRSFVRRQMPTANGPLAATMVCLYTNAPDEAFVIDRHPAAAGAAFASACSGLQVRAAGREILADLAVSGSISWPIASYRADRFSESVQPA
jgi:sarcosine oxidase